MSKNELTPEEKAFFDTGGETDLPADYAADAVVADPIDPAADGAQTEAVTPDPVVDAAAAAAVEGAAGPAAKNVENVPLATFMEEKKARQLAERNAAELTERFARADERIKLIQEAQQAAQKPQQPFVPPSSKDDLMGAVDYVSSRIQQFDQQAQQTAQQRQQQAEMQRTQQFVVGEYQRAAQERVATDPSFGEAQAYLLTQRYNERIAAGESAEQAYAGTQRDEYAFVEDAVRSRVNPADRILAVAKARGWAPKPVESAPTMTDAAKLAGIAQGQAAAGSLSMAGTSGNARGGKIDAKAIGEMSNKEFEAWYAKAGADGFRDAMGG